MPFIVMSLALAGCATHPATHANVSPDQQLTSIYGPGPSTGYISAPGAALAFDPPVLAGTARIDLSRDNRDTAAFAGYEDSKTTVYYLSSENRQGNFDSDEGYQRRAISETFGTTTR
ncbi:MAG: hypothetical protein M3O30_03405 [Planctomycetota bacterium]|nr:hypothetical protein [Planctomycetota bacterium]